MPGTVDRSFGRRHRLRGRSNFLAVLRSKGSRRLNGRHCWIAGVDATEGETRFGIVISSKTGSAVRRNRIKRKIREFLRINKQIWPPGKMIVIGLKGSVSSEAALVAEIEDMLKEIK
jgi:ribonuclease P protein component